MNAVAEAVDFQVWARGEQQRFERAAEAALPPITRQPARLHEAMRYAVLDGGKRVRPLLVYAAAELTGALPDAADRTALAVEYVHAYSLIHDDLPCMDDDVLRRGKPTVHIAFDEATAMLAGDALQAEAFKMIADSALPAVQTAQLMRLLAYAAGTEGMCGGQAIDLAAVGQSMDLAELEQMHTMKTGALLRAAVLMGAVCGEPARLTPAVEAALTAYGDALGLAFQIVDDVLDVEASSEVLGKTAGKDAAANKPTYVSLLGLEAAREWAARLHAAALAALDPLENDALVRGHGLRLRQLADFIVARSH